MDSSINHKPRLSQIPENYFDQPLAADSELPSPSPPKQKGVKPNKGLNKVLDENPINGTRAQMFRDCITKLAIDKIHQAGIGTNNPSLVLDLQLNQNA